MIATTRIRAIRHIDLANRRIEVEAGVVNLEVTRRVRDAGLS
jgi:FAD/FMN-containing dehydrogenase